MNSCDAACRAAEGLVAFPAEDNHVRLDHHMDLQSDALLEKCEVMLLSRQSLSLVIQTYKPLTNVPLRSWMKLIRKWF